MRTHWLYRLPALGAAWGATLPAQARYTLHDGDLARLAGLLGGMALLVFFYWLGIPLLLGGAVVLVGRLAGRAYQASAVVPLVLACLVWVAGLRWYNDYCAANQPAGQLAPDVAALFEEAAAEQRQLVMGLLAAASVGAATAGYFGVRKLRTTNLDANPEEPA